MKYTKDLPLSNRFPCYVKEILDANHQESQDIAILTTEGFSGVCKKELELDNSIRQDNARDELVYIIGYSGEYSMKSIEEKYESRAKSVKAAFQQALVALPPFELVASCGKLLSGGENPEHEVSTIAGMSGSPVVFEGKIIGI